MDIRVADFVQAREALGRRVASARLSRFGRSVHGADSDDREMEALEGGAFDAPPLLFHVIYQDAKGQMSGRAITTRRLEEETADIRVFAFCHMRSKLRAFLATRMVEVLDLSTGEIAEDGYSYFRTHPLLSSGQPDRFSPEARAIRQSRYELAILTFLSAADGVLDEDEEDAMVLHVCERADDDLDLEVVRRAVRGFTPDERAFRRALDCICAGHGDGVALRRSMRRVIDADGRVSVEELMFADAVLRRLAAAGV